MIKLPRAKEQAGTERLLKTPRCPGTTNYLKALAAETRVPTSPSASGAGRRGAGGGGQSCPARDLLGGQHVAAGISRAHVEALSFIRAITDAGLEKADAP